MKKDRPPSDSVLSCHPDLEFAVGVVLFAGEKILQVYESGFQVEFKDGREPVTRADREADAAIVDGLRGRFPDDAVLSEEQGLGNPRDDPGQRTWFVDPIDGTKEFIKRNGEFAVQVGLAVRDRLELGIVYQPVTRTLSVAAAGRGCYQRTGDQPWREIRIPAREGPPILALSRSHPSHLAEDVAGRIGSAGVFRMGGVGLKLLGIASGKAHFYLNDSNSTKAWDIAAPQILFTEAGGIVTDLEGCPFHYDPRQPFHRHGLLASCDGALHRQVLEILKTR